MGNCVSMDEGVTHILDDTNWENLTFNYSEYKYWDYESMFNESFSVPCHSTYCSTFLQVIPVFLILVGILGFICSVGLSVVLALRCQLQGRIGVILITASAAIFAAILPFIATGVTWEWTLGSTFCWVAHGLKHGSVFAQGLVVASGAGQLPRALLRQLLSVFLLLMGLLLGILATFFSRPKVEELAVCISMQEGTSWPLLHAIFCLTIFVILPAAVGFTKVVLKWQRTSNNLGIDVTWIFYLFWAPYGIAVFLDEMQKKGTLPVSCSLREELDYFLGISEGLGTLHCFLCPLGFFFYYQKAT